ncbi:PRC-barrel domain-containing protein [Mycobacterium sp. NPDC003323]
MTDTDLPDAPQPAGARLLDARLHLLDRQILDAEGEPVGIVDDLEIDEGGDAEPVITMILTGQVLFTRIFGGKPPRDQLQELPWRLVDRIGTSIHLRPGADTDDGRWVEHWLRDHIIGGIPGGRHATE